MSRVVLVVLIVMAALPAAAQAAENPPGAVWTGTGWAYPGQRLAQNVLVDRFSTFAADFWRDRQVTPCPNPTLWLAPDLGEGALARANPRTCEMWVRVSAVEFAQEKDTEDRLDGQMFLCDTILHETGHLAGLGHGKEGIMRSDGGNTSWVNAGRVASGVGACGVEVAALYNASRATPRSRLSTRRCNGRGTRRDAGRNRRSRTGRSGSSGRKRSHRRDGCARRGGR
jgi:hypothetical protein